VVSASFDDSTVPGFAAATAETTKLQQALTSRYAVPADHVITVTDASRVRLEQAFADAMSKASSAGQVFDVLAARMLADSKSPPLFAPKDFARSRASDTAV